MATIPLDACGPGASATVVHLFGLWGSSRLPMALVYVVVLWRSRSLVPRTCLLMDVEIAGRLALAFANPIATVGKAPGAVAHSPT